LIPQYIITRNNYYLHSRNEHLSTSQGVQETDEQNMVGREHRLQRHVVRAHVSSHVQIIVFRDIEDMINRFERLSRNHDHVDAVWTVCGRMDLARGYMRDDYTVPRRRCTRTTFWHPSLTAQTITTSKTRTHPYGCNWYTDRKWLII